MHADQSKASSESFPILKHAFDPRMNVAYGAEFLKSKHVQLGCWHKAIAHYHSATHSLGFKYKQDVIKIATNMNNYKDSLKKYARSSVVYPGKQLAQNASSDNYRRFNRPPEVYQKAYSIKSSGSAISGSKRFSQTRTRSNLMVPVPNSSRTE